MRSWRDLAAPDDPAAWYDVNNMMPTPQGTYVTIPPSTAAEVLTATGCGTVRYCFVAQTLSGLVEWVFDSSKIWFKSGLGLSDKTNGVTIGTYPYATQYGNVTIVAMGVGNATVASTSGGNFAALSGAPQAEIVLVHANAVLAFNTGTSVDGWAASDVGDHTNWTTGEAASGRLIATPGQILGAVSLGDSVFVWKARGIYRMWYVGGAVKWASELVDSVVGMGIVAGSLNAGAKYAVAASDSLALFTANPPQSGCAVRIMDATGQSRVVNPETSVTGNFIIQYLPAQESFVLVGRFSVQTSYLFCPATNAWGKTSAPYHATNVPLPLVGQADGQIEYVVPFGVAYYKTDTNQITRYTYASTEYANTSCYLESSRFGRADRKTAFSRLTPLLRRGTTSGGDSATLSMTLWREREDTTAASTRSISQASNRRRFDLAGGACSDTFARFKVTWPGINVEVDDFLVTSKDGGAE